LLLIRCARGCRYKRADARDDWKTIHVIASGETATSMSVHSLESNTAYKFMVLSRNRLGDGLFSATLTATTKGQLLRYFEPNRLAALCTIFLLFVQ